MIKATPEKTPDSASVADPLMLRPLHDSATDSELRHGPSDEVSFFFWEEGIESANLGVVFDLGGLLSGGICPMGFIVRELICKGFIVGRHLS